MLNWLSSLFMNSTSDAAFEAAVYSADLASIGGMHQMKEPEAMQEIAKAHKASK